MTIYIFSYYHSSLNDEQRPYQLNSINCRSDHHSIAQTKLLKYFQCLFLTVIAALSQHNSAVNPHSTYRALTDNFLSINNHRVYKDQAYVAFAAPKCIYSHKYGKLYLRIILNRFNVSFSR